MVKSLAAMRETQVRSLEEGMAKYSCLENCMDKGAWRAAVLGVTKNQTQLSD